MTTQPWEPGQDDPDRADDIHELLAALPVGLRTAGAALLELPAEQVIGVYRDPPGSHYVDGLAAGAAFVHLVCGRMTPQKVMDLLTEQRLVRPGLVEAGNPNREDPAMPVATPTVTYYAVVGRNLYRPDEPCDREGCRAPAEFEVGTAVVGALVSDVLGLTCVEHLGEAVRRACDS